MTQTIKAGTRIDFLTSEGSEPAKIARWTKVNGPIKNHVSPTNGGWHIVEFPHGGRLCVHETNFRVTDNRSVAA